jgi:hypothetical protein
MKKSIKNLGLSKIANSYVDRMDQMEKLKEIANRKNYPHKVKQLTAKITEEFNFWSKKNHSNKLEDLKKDLNFIQSQVNETTDKSRVDLLMDKYGLK